MTALPPGVIVNADDLGIHPRVNAGILSAYRTGILSSSTMLMTTPHVEAAIRDVVRAAEMPVGIHLSLTAGKPVAPAEQIPDLVDSNGDCRYSASKLLVSGFSGDSGRRLLAQIRTEFTAQLALARDLGVTPTHIDSHQHIHMNPAIFKVFEEVAEKFGIDRYRFCREPFPSFALYLNATQALLRKNHLKWALIRWRGSAIRPRFPTTDYFFGILYSGIMTKQVLLSMLEWLPPQASLEIGIHPGFRVHPGELGSSESGFAGFISSPARQEEHDALAAEETAELIRRRGLRLRSFDGALKPD